MIIDLSSNYAGVSIKNPLVAASSGLTSNLNRLEDLSNAGIGAIVLKSLFEEQIEAEAFSESPLDSYEGLEYMQQYIKAHKLEQYIDLIRQAKSSLPTPIIASLNCYKKGEWVTFATQIERAGADALELNIMRLETDKMVDESFLVNQYVNICAQVARKLSIPVAVKIDNQFACTVALVDKLRASGVRGITCFNRSYQMDIDIDSLNVIGSNPLTTSSELSTTLKYTGILSAKIPQLPVSASGGVHNYQAIVKCLLAGASSVQFASVLYQKGPKVILDFLENLKSWMQSKGYCSINEFKGILNAKNLKDGSLYERMQFMKYFASEINV